MQLAERILRELTTAPLLTRLKNVMITLGDKT